MKVSLGHGEKARESFNRAPYIQKTELFRKITLWYLMVTRKSMITTIAKPIVFPNISGTPQLTKKRKLFYSIFLYL